MATVAYLRVSTHQQDLDNQKLAILEYAHAKGVQIDRFVEYQISSRRSTKERGLDALFASLVQQDTLIVSELSRLGRSLGQIIQLVDKMISEQIHFIAIKENISIQGQQDLQTKVMVTMFGLFAEIERDLISERTKEGLAAARASGKLLGRPKGSLGRSRLDGKEEEIQLLLEKGVSKTAIAKIMGISRTALYSFIQSRELG